MELELKDRLTRLRLRNAAENALVGFIILVAVVLFSPANTSILPRDEGVFVYIGRGILEGKLPYRDLWDHKGPLIYYIDALGLWIGRNSLWGVWLVEALLLALSLVLLYRLLRAILSREAALFGLLVWVIGFAVVLGGNIVEEYSIPLTVLALCMALQRPRWAGFWLGLLAGLECMLRPNEIAGPVVGLLFVLADHAHSKSWNAAVSGILSFTGGFLLVAGGFAAYFAANHALGDFLGSVILFNFYYVSRGGNLFTSLLAGLGYVAIPVLFGITGLLAALFAAGPALGPERKRLLYITLALFVAVVPLSLLSGRVYRHYYIPWLLPLAILSSYSVLWFRNAGAGNRLAKASLVCCWTVLILAAILAVRVRVVPLLAGGAPPPEDAEAVAAIRDLQPRTSELFIWGDETSYAVMADRRLAGRYPYTSPLLMSGYGEGMAPRLLADISASRPLIIDATGAGPEALSLDGDPPHPYLAPLYAFIHENYEVIGHVPGKDWTVWGPK